MISQCCPPFIILALFFSAKRQTCGPHFRAGQCLNFNRAHAYLPKSKGGHSSTLLFLASPSFTDESTTGLDTTGLRLISRWPGIGPGYPSGPEPNGPISQL